MSRHDKSPVAERVYTSLWHLLIAGVGVYELRNHKTKLSKVLATGLIAFHIDGALADLTDTTPYSRKLINALTGKPGIREYVADKSTLGPERRLAPQERRRIR